MNRKLYFPLSVIIVLFIVFYFLIWPFINSAISGNYYLKVSTDGSPNYVYIADIQTGNNEGPTLTSKVYGRSNVATQKDNDGAETYVNTITDADVENVKLITDKVKGAHLSVRRKTGYTFAYDNNGFASALFSSEDRSALLRLAQILEYYARGDEIIPDAKRVTYIMRGREQMKSLMEGLGLEYQT